MNEIFDVVIVGAGTAGLAALREVKKRTGNLILINDGAWGTVCARVGCMPSKTLIHGGSPGLISIQLSPAFQISSPLLARPDV